ncbi:MAG TPA: hypothetical protein VL337_04715 [Acidimicrobiales bacterium]|nr:hypothetical protein [Acidimicrobiales bacterium]HVE24237.1 hypothetical protein [Sporichthya sp.]
MIKVLAALAVAFFGPVAAASAAVSGTEAFTIFSSGGARTVTGTGVFNGVGSQFVDARQDNPNGTFTARERLVFPEGTLVTATAGSRSASFDATTCVRTVTSSGTLAVLSGSGRFTGATGGGTFSARAVLRGTRGPSGCSDEHLVILVIRVASTLTLP